MLCYVRLVKAIFDWTNHSSLSWYQVIGGKKILKSIAGLLQDILFDYSDNFKLFELEIYFFHAW